MKAAKIADMSALLEVLPRRSRRTEQNRQAKERQRARAQGVGLVKVEVMLTTEAAQLVTWLRKAQSGDMATFVSRALVVGAKFVYNSGNVRGGKKRIKGTV